MELSRKKKALRQQQGKKKRVEDYDSEEEEDDEETYGITIPRNVWIMKPGENSNRGCGIFVCSSIREVMQEMNSPDKRNHTHII